MFKDLFQADLVEIAKVNKSYKYVVVMIDCFSKYAFTMPIKSKSADNIVETFNILNKYSMKHL